MNAKRAVLVLALVFLGSLGGCATVKYGDKSTEEKLRELKPIPGKTSLYVCRENAVLSGAGNRTTVVVDGQKIGTLKPNNFAHTVVNPGEHDIYLERHPGGDSGILKIQTQADEVSIVWAGVTGAGFGVLTVDNFSNKNEAEQCVRGAAYAVQAEP